MPLLDSAIIANGLQNFQITDNNTNDFATDLIANSAIVSDEGVINGFQILQTVSPSNQVRIQFSASAVSKNGKVGVACLKTPDNEFLPITIRSATALLLDIPENVLGTVRNDLICLYGDFRTAEANNFRLRLFTGSSLADPDLDAWMIANPNQILMPIGRIAKTPGTLVDSSQIVMNGNTTYNPASSVRRVCKYNAGTIKVMTLAERDASSWQPGDLVIVKAPLDINNALWVNMSSTPTAFWKQVVLVAQAVFQWILGTPQNLPSGSGTFNLPENQGSPSGGFTLPASFFAVGTVLLINDVVEASSSSVYGSNALLHTCQKNFAINGTAINGGIIGRSGIWNGSNFSYSPALAPSLSSTLKVTCTEIIGNNAKISCVRENWNHVSGQTPTKGTSAAELFTIANNVPLTVTQNFVNTIIGAGGILASSVINYSIQKQQ